MRQTFWGLASATAVLSAAVTFVAGCSSGSSNPTPPGTTPDASMTDSSSVPDGTTGSTDGGSTGDTGTGLDAAADVVTVIADGSCMPDAFPPDAGCTPCAADPILACASFNVTCVPFDDTQVPDAHF